MKRIILILTLILTLSACAYTEPDAMFTVTEIGFAVSGEKTELILKINEQEKGRLISGQGENAYEAFRAAATKLEKKASFEHLQLIAVSENLEGERLNDVLSFCEKRGAPLRTRLVYAENLQKILEENGNLLSLLKQGEAEFGFGGNTTLFEIETAILVNDGDFALPYIKLSGEDIELCGLLRYKNNRLYKRLDINQSIKYKKEVLG